MTIQNTKYELRAIEHFLSNKYWASVSDDAAIKTIYSSVLEKEMTEKCLLKLINEVKKLIGDNANEFNYKERIEENDCETNY